MTLSPEDLDALADAVRRLECPSAAIKLANTIGTPIEKAVAMLPARSKELIQAAARNAIEKCLHLALRTIDAHPRKRSSDRLHKAATLVSGAIGGSFGIAALAAELPLSTTIMLRSIADIGRSEGENLADPEAHLACLEVFALGGPAAGDDSAEVGYYAVRAALAQTIQRAAAFISERGFIEAGAPPIVRLVTAVASRFGVAVSEKAALQAVPVVGAVTGSAVNWIFIEHFQNVGRGHFVIRRLERKYGAEAVRAAYEHEKKLLIC